MKWFVLIIVVAMEARIFQGLESNKKPNILLIIADDLGYRDVGIFGNTTIRTPNIDRIGREGMTMTHHLAAASVCTSSRAAFYTGKYPIKIGMAPTNRMRVIPWAASTSGIPVEETTVAHLAQQSGYSTALIGKWHLGLHCNYTKDFCHHPLNQGFDYFYGGIMTLVKDFGNAGESVILTTFPRFDSTICAIVSAAYFVILTSIRFNIVGRKVGLFILFIVISLGGFIYWIPHGGTKVANSLLHRNFELVEQPIRFEKLTQRLVWEAEEFIEGAKKQDKPFFLVASWFQVHTVLYNSVPGFAGSSKHGPYGDNIEEMDWSVGRLLSTLDRLKLASNTIVYFTSDNGGHVEELNHLGQRAGGDNRPWEGGKLMGGVDGGIRVPTAIRWPGKIKAGTTSNEPTSQMDILPTVAKTMGVKKLPKDIDGLDLDNLLTSPATVKSPHKFLFHYCGHKIHAVRWRSPDKMWKLRLATPAYNPGTEGCDYTCQCYDTGNTGIRNGVIYHDPPLLFDITTDPYEKSPLDKDSDQYSKMAPQLQAAMKDHMASLEADFQVDNQFAWYQLMWRPWLQPCCNFPLCSCRDQKWDHRDKL